MPFYEVECKKCHCCYDVFSGTMAEKEKSIKKAKCKECGSKSKRSLISRSNFNFEQPEGTDRYENSHDYRYNHKHNKSGGVRDQREFAENNSHMGRNPYPGIDDISSGKHFGDVK